MKKTIIFLSGLLLSGCASITGGTNQTLSVETPNHEGATCSLKNNKGEWFIPQTPGSVVVHRSFEDLFVTCRKGNKTGESAVKSKTKGMTFGNVLLGGGIGAAIDCSSGAAYDYPNKISVDLKEPDSKKVSS